jgi:hypothetical protein
VGETGVELVPLAATTPRRYADLPRQHCEVAGGDLVTGGTRWGAEISYGRAHVRIREARGRASDHRCIDRGRQAEQWPYRGDSANEL